METWIKSGILYSGKIVSLRVGDVSIDNDTSALREVVEHPGGVAVVPVLNDSVVLVRQYRIAIGCEILEVPAGRLEGDELPEARARCELEEETGYRARRMLPIGAYYSSVGFTTEKISMFLAFDLQEVGQRLEIDERIQLVKIPIGEIEKRLFGREFEDAKTVICLHELLAYFNSVKTEAKE